MPNKAVHHSHTIDPRLGERFGAATRWVELAGSFVKSIERFGSLAPKYGQALLAPHPSPLVDFCVR